MNEEKVVLPNGGALYKHSEIAEACAIAERVIAKYGEAVTLCNEKYQLQKASQGFKERFFGLFKQEDLFHQVWSEMMNPLEKRWGRTVWSEIGGQSQTNATFAYYDLKQLEMSKRDCYLNPKQVEVLEKLLKVSNVE